MMKSMLAAGLVLASLNAATAATLPKPVLGRWCAIPDGGKPSPIGTGWFNAVINEQEWSDCRKADGYLTVSPTGYLAHETKCRFVKVRDTGRKSVPHTKSKPSELVPVMRVTARCSQESETYSATFEISFWKGSLVIEDKPERRP